MNLVIVESPSKAKVIEKYLKGEGDYKVVSSVGHIRDLNKKNLSIDIENDFRPIYVISPGKSSIAKDITSKASRADKIILATDEDREGEAIAWHISEIIKDKLPDAPKMERITFNEITKSAILAAIKSPRGINLKLKEAQEARRVLDRIFGYRLSEFLWKKVRYGLSAGRVQSPALRILVTREKEIRNFKPEKYFEISVTFQSQKNPNNTIHCEYQIKPKSEEENSETLESIKVSSWSIGAIERKLQDKNPNPPFTTATLQQYASSRLGMSPSQTMATAQKLYEKGFITYMRTDSVHLSKDAIASINAVISEKFGKEKIKNRVFKNKNKHTQEAHEAIRPTDASRVSAGNTVAEKRLYELIRARAIASQMVPAKILRTKIIVVSDNAKLKKFIAKGNIVKEKGWIEMDASGMMRDAILPELEEGEKLNIDKLLSEEKETLPPPRYTEAGLVKELEKLGIGRPSTYASIISTLIRRGYAIKEKRVLIPTDTAEVVIDFLAKNFTKYVDYGFTSDMERSLDMIAEGEESYAKLVSEFYRSLEKDIEANRDIPKLTNLGEADKKYKCPECGGGMIIKLSRTGKFLSCAKFPECKGMLNMQGEGGDDDAKQVASDPETGAPIYLRSGRYGKYLQVGEDAKKAKKISLTAFKNLNVEDNPDLAIKIASLPRILGKTDAGEDIIANIGRFGPYVGIGRNFRSVPKKYDIFTINKDEALELLSAPKKLPKGASLAKELGKDPKTGKEIRILKSKSGYFIMRGLKRLYLNVEDVSGITIENYQEYLQ